MKQTPKVQVNARQRPVTVSPRADFVGVPEAETVAANAFVGCRSL